MKTILVIEDDASIRELIAYGLRGAGYSVLEAENGIAGTELARRHVPDLIVSDLVMEEGDGLTALAALRLDPHTASIPFIIVTALDDRESLRHGMELGADDYLTKPFKLQEVLAAVDARLKRQQAVLEREQSEVEDLKLNLTLVLPSELRTPLIGILGYALALAKEAPKLAPEQVTEMANGILAAGERLYRLIENFMLYAQLEVLERAPDSVCELKHGPTRRSQTVLELAARKRAHLAGRSADLLLRLCDAPTPCMSGLLLSKLADELLDNAFRFSAGGSQVEVVSTVEGGVFVLQVADRGCGMSAEQLASAGTRVHFKRPPAKPGHAGLGLALARRIAEVHEGVLTLTSEVGVGTAVTVRLPLRGEGQQVAQPR